MFSGIIQGKGFIVADTTNLGIKKITINTPEDWSFKNGESVCVDGICSTVISSEKKLFSVQYMSETLNKTTAQNFSADRIVNLEKSLKVGDTIDGHFVYGHIDTLSVVTKIKNEHEVKVITFSLPKEIEKYVVYKGSIAINGVSLTVSNISKKEFEVSLIPYTLECTNLGQIKVGDMVNIETDIIGRYIEKSLKINNAKKTNKK